MNAGGLPASDGGYGCWCMCVKGGGDGGVNVGG